jgi:hypothetical protein
MDSRFSDICISRLLEYRTLLNASRAGYPGHTSPQTAAYYETMVVNWERIKAAGTPDSLPDDLRKLYDIAATDSGRP